MYTPSEFPCVTGEAAMGDPAHRTTGPDGSRADGDDDAAVIARSLRSPECFGTIFDRHAPAIYRYICRRLGPDSAEDLVAETFLVAFRRRGRYDGGYPDARPWLYGIATRLIGRHRRDETRFFQAIARTGVDPASETFDGPVIDRVAAQAARPELAGALARLSQAHRDVLLLVASGLSYPEAGLAMGLPAGTVSSRLFTARRIVRGALGGTDPTRPEGGTDPSRSAGTDPARPDGRKA